MKQSLFGICLLGVVLCLSGCFSSPVRRIAVDGGDALITISSIDPLDWQRAAAENIQSLLASGALKRADGKESIVMIGRIRNYTLQHLETKILTAKIRSSVLASGQAKVSSAVGTGCNVDLSVRRIRDKELDDLFQPETVQKRGTVIAPNMSLSGAITQQTTYQGRTEESYFLFYLVLTDLTTGIAVWEHTVDVLKQGTYPLL